MSNYGAIILFMEFTDAVLRLLVAAGLGGIIGLEREYRDKSAGFRTQLLIALGTALFTISALDLSSMHGSSDPARIIGYIIAGIGFIGAGAIAKDGFSIKGLTTSSTIWVGAGIGIASGMGDFSLAAVATIIAMFALIALPGFEHWIDHLKRERTYTITATSLVGLDDVMSKFRSSSLKVHDYRRSMNGGNFVLRLVTSGKPNAHRHMEDYLLNEEKVIDF